VLIGTHALATGLDAPGVTTVIHCGAPFTLLNLVQGLGRAARETGTVGHAYLLAQRENSRTATLAQRQISEYVDSSTCLHEQLSSFVDDSKRSCRNLAWEVQCDVCSPPHRIIGTVPPDLDDDTNLLIALAESNSGFGSYPRAQPFETASTSTLVPSLTLLVPATVRWTSDPHELAQLIRQSLFKATESACLRCWYRAREGFHLHSTMRCPLLARGNAASISAQLQGIQYTDADRCGSTMRETCRRCGHPTSACKLMHRTNRNCQAWANDDPKLKMLGVLLHEMQRGEERLAATIEEAHLSCSSTSPPIRSGTIQDLDFMRDHPFEVYTKPFTFQDWRNPAHSTVFFAQSHLYTLCSWLLWAFLHAQPSKKSSLPMLPSISPQTPATGRARQTSSSSAWTADTLAPSEPFTIASSSPFTGYSASAAPRLLAPAMRNAVPSAHSADPHQTAAQRKEKVSEAIAALKKCCGSCIVSGRDFHHPIDQCTQLSSGEVRFFMGKVKMGATPLALPACSLRLTASQLSRRLTVLS
jgi:Helicase conserved C-terminal domain